MTDEDAHMNLGSEIDWGLCGYSHLHVRPQNNFEVTFRKQSVALRYGHEVSQYKGVD